MKKIHEKMLNRINEKKLEALNEAVQELVTEINNKSNGNIHVSRIQVTPNLLCLDEPSQEENTFKIDIKVDDNEADHLFGKAEHIKCYQVKDAENISAEDLDSLKKHYKEQIPKESDDDDFEKSVRKLAIKIAVLYSAADLQYYDNDIPKYTYWLEV